MRQCGYGVRCVKFTVDAVVASAPKTAATVDDDDEVEYGLGDVILMVSSSDSSVWSGLLSTNRLAHIDRTANVVFEVSPYLGLATHAGEVRSMT
jgi:hypothetical protein